MSEKPFGGKETPAEEKREAKAEPPKPHKKMGRGVHARYNKMRSAGR